MAIYDFFPAREGEITDEGGGRVSVSSALLQEIAERAFADMAFFFTKRHLERLIAAALHPAASQNDRYVLSRLLRNAAISARGTLPLCQDTGIANVFAFKDNGVFARGEKSEPRAFNDAVRAVYAQKCLRFSTVMPRAFFDEYDPRDNLPAHVMIFSGDPLGCAGDAVSEPSYRILFSAKGGGSSNKTKLIQGTKALLNEEAFQNLLRREIAAIGASACPPYTITVVAGGLSPEQNLLALKLAASGYFDSDCREFRRETMPLRDAGLEDFVLTAARETGIGAGAGGSQFALDAVVLRLPRHGASCPVSIGASCSAHRCLKAVIGKDGVYMEQTVKSPESLPGFHEAVQSGEGGQNGTRITAIDTSRGIPACLEALSRAPLGSRVLVSGPVLVARDAAHSRWKQLIDSGNPLPGYASRYPIFYAGPAETPPGHVCGSVGPTTAGRMDGYADMLMKRGAALVTLAKGNRAENWRLACGRYGAFYLGVPGGCAALIAEECVTDSAVLDYEDLGMEAVRLLTVRNLPAFVLIDNNGGDFYAKENC